MYVAFFGACSEQQEQQVKNHGIIIFQFQRNMETKKPVRKCRYELNVEHMLLILLSMVTFTIKLEGE